MIAASGLRRAFPVAPQSLYREKFLEEARQHVENVRNAREGIVVVGGGELTIQIRISSFSLIVVQVRWESKWQLN